MPDIKQTLQKIDSFANLPRGWRFGKGDSIPEERRRFAVRLLEYADQYYIARANAFALEDGGLLVSFYIDVYTLDLTLESNGSLTIAKDFKDEQLSFDENLNIADAYDKIWEFSTQHQNQNLFSTRQSQSLLESYTRTTTNRNLEDLKVRLLPHRQRTTVYRASNETARSKIAERSADTSRSAMPHSPERPQSFGTYH